MMDRLVGSIKTQSHLLLRYDRPDVQRARTRWGAKPTIYNGLIAL